MTPKYVFSRKKIEDCYYLISRKMDGVRIFYSLKANAEKKVLQILNDIGANFEIASIGEFCILKEINVSSDRIICGLPIKPINWLQYIYLYGCSYYVFDDISELKKIITYAPLSKKILRININDLIPDSIEFGMEYHEAISLLSQDVEMGNYVDGLSFHISNNTNISNFNHVMDRIETLLPLFSLKRILLNIGGGYRLDAADDFFENLRARISELKRIYNIDIIAEPGNTIVNSAGSIYTTVIRVKKKVAIQMFI